MSFEFRARIYWEDTDAGGIVYYANYLKLFERARTEWLRSLGIGQQVLRETNGGMFVVSETQIKYHRPARLDDELLLTARLLESGRASLTMAQEAYGVPTGNPAEGRGPLLCEASIRIGWVRADTMKPERIPSNILEALQ